MRKDVKLGFAIGGVMLAVLIVYVLVVPGGGDKRVTSATGGDGTSQTQGGGGVSLEPVAPTTPATQPSGGGGTVAGTPPAAPPASFTPPAGGTDPFEQPEAVASNANSKTKDVDWSKLLNDSQMLMVQTPSKPPAVATPPPPPTSSTESKQADVQPVSTSTSSSVPDISKPGPTPVTPPPSAPTPPSAPPANEVVANDPPAPPANVNVPAGTIVDPPAPTSAGDANSPPPVAEKLAPVDAAGQKIHVVQAGESFSTISMIAYGNPNLYSAIMRANPGVDPVKLRPGMKINIPPASEARPAAPPPPATPVLPAAMQAPGRTVSGDSAQVASNRPETPIDPLTQYRVQPGDNLYSISKKLYGRGDRYLRIHEANKQTLGDDANTLKAGMVLALPEPPTAK